MLHEFGHVMHNVTPHMSLPAKWSPTGKSFLKEARRRAGYLDTKLVASDISPYALTDEKELFAEVFTLFNRPGGIDALDPAVQARLRAYRDAINELAGAVVL
jgi:hypothetical protein